MDPSQGKGKEVFPALGEAFPGCASTDIDKVKRAALHAEHTSVNRGWAR